MNAVVRICCQGFDEHKGLARFAGLVGVAGAALLLCGASAAGGAWWRVAGLLHLSAGAGSVLLAAQAFALHMYCQHWCGTGTAFLWSFGVHHCRPSHVPVPHPVHRA